MAGDEIKMIEDERRQATALRRHVLANVFARIGACVLAAAAALLLVFNRQTINLGGVAMRADFKTISTFKFFIGGNAVVSFYCLISLIHVVAHQRKAGLIHLCDLVALELAAAAAAATTSVSYVGKYGEDKAGWMPVCGYFAAYCRRVVAILAVAFAAVACCFCFCVLQPPKPWTPRGAAPRSGAAAGNRP